MAEIPFEVFLATFSRLRTRVHGNPRNLRWRAKNDPSLGELASEVNNCVVRVMHGLAASQHKSATPPAAFRSMFQDYREFWKDAVESVAAERMTQQLDELIGLLEKADMQKLEQDSPELAEKLLAPADFDPTMESAYDLVDDIFWWADTIKNNEKGTDTGDSLHKAFQAWNYYQNTIGVDLLQIWHRWSKAQTIFVPPHVAIAHSPEERGGLFDLLDEAHKAFVFGAHGAAIALCRALTEIVLVRHYGVAEGNLKDVIVFAETTHSWIRQLRLQDMRKLANRVLHRGEKADEDAVVSYLATIKQLIERAPLRAS